ncbi:MAG: hypothetical protein HYZ20_08390 [Burkholderiales bacterium]|nr:hypothetical protein [Burkholderiales bacterium]
MTRIQVVDQRVDGATEDFRAAGSLGEPLADLIGIQLTPERQPGDEPFDVAATITSPGSAALSARRSA